MLYYLAELSHNLSALNVFRYITFRAGGAFFTALIYGFLFGRPLIELLRVRQGRGPADPRRRAGEPPRDQARHADDGRAC